MLGTVPGQATPAGTPVDLGNIWSTQTPAETFPCATPTVTGTTNTATPTCNGYLSYSQVGDPRNFMPTERFRFQSNYFKNFETSGSIGYSTQRLPLLGPFGGRERLDRANSGARQRRPEGR